MKIFTSRVISTVKSLNIVYQPTIRGNTHTDYEKKLVVWSGQAYVDGVTTTQGLQQP